MATTVKLDLTLTQNLTRFIHALQGRSFIDEAGDRQVKFVTLEPSGSGTHKGVNRSDLSVDFTLLSARLLPIWLLDQVSSALAPMSLRVQVDPDVELS